jgi:hypothetical protein
MSDALGAPVRAREQQRPRQHGRRAQPTDAQRYCGACEKHVHDLSALTRVEAKALLATRPICVRVRVDAQGRQTALPAAPQQTAPRKARRALKRAAPHDAELGVGVGVGPARELLGEPTQDLLGAPLAD